jgi:hypothetical protein
MSRVIVLQAELGGDGEDAAGARLLQRLPYARRLELELRDVQSRRASLRGTGLVLDGLSQLCGRPVAAGELRFPQGGKPYCADAGSFSVTHTEQRVAVALCRDCDVGIDMEDLPTGIDPGSGAYRKLERWTAVEAVLKAAGMGLRHAGRVVLDAGAARARLDDREFFLRRIELVPGVVAHVATASQAGPVELV